MDNLINYYRAIIYNVFSGQNINAITPTIALLFGFAIIISRPITMFVVLEPTTRLLLRFDHSLTRIKKISQSASVWKRTTGLCFWGMESSKKSALKVNLILRTIAVVTWPIPLLLSVLYCFDTRFGRLWLFFALTGYLFDLFHWFIMSLYSQLIEKQYDKRGKR